MYEHYLDRANGIVDIDITTQPEADDIDSLLVSFEYAVFTDSTAMLSIDYEGTIYAAFGGTGTTDDDLAEYAATAVRIWRAITGKEDTVCTISGSDMTVDP